MTPDELLAELATRGVEVWREGERLRLRSATPPPADLLAAVRERTPGLLDLLDPPTHPAFARVHQRALRAFLATIPPDGMVPGVRYPAAPWERRGGAESAESEAYDAAA